MGLTKRTIQAERRAIRTPMELIPPGKPFHSSKDNFFAMREFAAQEYRAENGIEDGVMARIEKRKPRKARVRNLEYRSNYR